MMTWILALVAIQIAVSSPDGSCDASGVDADLSQCGAPRVTDEALTEFFGEFRRRSDSWLVAVSTMMASDAASKRQSKPPSRQVAEKSFVSAATLLGGPLLHNTVATAWRNLSSTSIKEAPDLEELSAHFVWRYYDALTKVLGEDKMTAVVTRALKSLAKFPNATWIRAGLLLASDSSLTRSTLNMLREAADTQPSNTEICLRLGLTFEGFMDNSKALKVLTKCADNAFGQTDVDARLLTQYAYVAAKHGNPDGGHIRSVLSRAARLASSFERASSTRNDGWWAGAIASVYEASMFDNKVPTAICGRIFRIDRDLSFRPDDCLRRLELGVLLRDLNQVPAAVSVGKELLATLVFDCPNMTEIMSGMGQHWIDEPDAKANRMGLAGSLNARADLRKGIRDLGLEAPSSRERLLQVYRTAKVVERLPSPAEGASRCELESSIRPRVTAPGREEARGCPVVKATNFAKRCLKRRVPCVLREVAKDFLRIDASAEAPSRGLLERWAMLAPNATVSVAFPFDAVDAESFPSVNSVRNTQEFRAESNEKVDINSDSKDTQWTLVRPRQWWMRFSDAVTWASKHPSQDFYLKQMMLVDLGPKVLADLKQPSWVSSAELKLFSPNLWFASGPVVTGYHWDAFDNLMLQLGGEKEVVVLAPSEKDNLYYEDVDQAVARAELNDSSTTVDATGFTFLNRIDDTHSVIDVARPSALVMAKFPRYAEARGATCKLKPGDVLYIPAFWHHAVATTPGPKCQGVSLNLWYTHPDRPQSFDEALNRSKKIRG